MNQWKTWCVVAIAALAAGCGAIGGRTWVPQGPGEYPEGRPQREASPRPTSPALVAPPRTAAAAQPSTPATAAAAAGSYTQATRYGDLLFVSGQIAIDPASNQLRGATAEEQTTQIMENIRAILESHRLTMANVVAVTVYLKTLNDFRAMDTAYDAFFRSALPARSVVEVARLPRNALVEISVIAGR